MGKKKLYEGMAKVFLIPGVNEITKTLV